MTAQTQNKPASNFPAPDRKKYRKRMIDTYRMAFDRNLLNLAGCNYTVRASDVSVYITRSGGTRDQLGRIDSDDLIHADFNGNIIDGEGPLSIEYLCHTTVIKEFPWVDAVLHTHSRFATIMAARMEAIPAFIESMLGYGDTLIVSDEHRYSTPGFVADIIRLMKENPAMYSKGGCAVLYPRHGVLVAHRSPELAFDLAERVEWNAEAVVYDRLMGTTLPRQLPPHADRPEDPIGESKPAR
ncbi:5-(methylthio)ribulose-1-phosphate aldolase [Aquamicrobium terrae]